MRRLESEGVSVSAPASPGPGGLRLISSLPGPRGWPLLGNIPQVRKAHLHQNVEAWSKRYGPFFRLKLGPQAMLVVADHEAINSILRDRPDGFRRASRLREVGEEMGSVPGLFSAEGERWRKQRRMVTASFAPNHVRAYFPSLLKVTGRLQARWQKAALRGAAIDLQADLKRFTTDIIAGLAFGKEVNSLESEENSIQRHLDVVLAGVYRRVMAPFPYWRWLRLPADRQLERSNAALRHAIYDFVAQARARMEANPDLRENPRNLLEAMIAAADQGDLGLDNDDVVGNVSAILKAHLRGGPCRTYFVDVKLRVEAADVFYYPDVFVTCEARDLEDPLVKRHPVLVVEVRSESTAETDRDEKFADYRKLETLREYVLVDSRVRHVVSYRRKDDGTWQFVPATAEETLTLESVGLTVPVAALYEDTDVPARRARPEARG